MLRLRFDSARTLGHEPGQFVELSILGVGEAPFGVSSSPTVEGAFELGIRKAGAVTSAVHELRPGDRTWIRGPFGLGFDVSKLRGRHILAVAGGIGLVPLRSIINYVLDRPEEFLSLTILYGSRDPSEILRYPDLERWTEAGSVDFRMIVDHADETWSGAEGLITTLIPPLDIDPANTSALIVGPPVMFKFVIHELRQKGIRDDQVVVSLERMMKCGVGKCGHCAIGDRYCCTDGPVFTYADIKNSPEAL
jgi:NAD(P)H-flavin reductase